MCRAAAAPCPAYDACCLSLIFLPLLLKLAVVGLNTTDTLPPGRGYLRTPAPYPPSRRRYRRSVTATTPLPAPLASRSAESGRCATALRTTPCECG
ncbi:TPA: hypothetical protein MIP49_10850 [Klebsiella pneumoniae]|nr:hypothetical protein [Klebsiella pneumoniae]